MTEIERKALALIAEIKEERGMPAPDYLSARAALISAIEQHEAFRQEVSDAVVNLNRYWERCEPAKEDFYARFDRFIIPKPDPLVDAVQDWWDADGYNDVANLRAAIEKRGGKIVWGEGE